MKTVLFAASLAMSVAFLSCSIADKTESQPNCGGMAAKQSYEDDFDYENLDPICKSEQKKLIQIHDTYGQINYPEEGHWDDLYSHLPDYAPGSVKSFPQLKGSSETGWNYYVYNIVDNTEVDITQEEYDEYMRKAASIEKIDIKKRDLPIPCVVGDYDVVWWAMLTDEEVAELEEAYDELVIYDPSKYLDGSVEPTYEEDARVGANAGSGGCSH